MSGFTTPMSVGFIVLLSVLASIAQRGSKVLVALNALHLGASPFTVGVLAALYAAFPLLLAVYAGRVSDRIGVRLPILLGAFVMAAGLLPPVIASQLSGASIAVLFLCPILIGLGHIFLHVSVHNAIGALGRAQERSGNFALFSLGGSVAAFIGPALAGIAVDGVGFGIAFPLLAAIVALTGILALLFPRLMPPRPAAARADHAGGALALLRNAPLRRTLVMSGVTLTGIELFTFYFPIYGTSVGLSATVIGLALSTYAAAAFVVRLGLPRLSRRFSAIGILTGSLFVAAATYLLLPFFAQAWILAAFAFTLGLGLGSAQPLTIMLTYDHAPPGRSGEALGMRLTVNKLTQILVPLVFGGIGMSLGLLPVFWANGAFLLAGGVVSMRFRVTAAASK